MPVRGAEDWQQAWEKLSAIAAALNLRHNDPGEVMLTSSLILPSEDEEGEEYFDDKTMMKVYNALRKVPMPDHVAIDAISAMQDAGILFRERHSSGVKESNSRDTQPRLPVEPE